MSVILLVDGLPIIYDGTAERGQVIISNWDGKLATSTRVDEQYLPINRPRLSISLSTQQDTFQRIMQKYGVALAESGVFGRFLLCGDFPPAPEPYFDHERPLPGLKRCQDRMMELLYEAEVCKKDRNLKARCIRLSAGARVAHKQQVSLCRYYFQQCHPAALYRYNYGRFAQYVLRIAIAITVLDNLGTEISVSTYANAVAIMNWHMGQAVRMLPDEQLMYASVIYQVLGRWPAGKLIPSIDVRTLSLLSNQQFKSGVARLISQNQVTVIKGQLQLVRATYTGGGLAAPTAMHGGLLSIAGTKYSI